MKVSICIVTKDSYRMISKCLKSIQTYVKYSDLEVLICDTGSTDKRVFDLYSNYMVFERKYHFSQNNNFLASKAEGDILLIMNNDVYFTYDAVSKMVPLIKDEQTGCLGHRLVFEHDNNLIEHDGQIIFNGKGEVILPGHKNHKKHISGLNNSNIKVDGITGAFLMIRKNLFNEVEGFDEMYSDIYQDVDLSLKVSNLGLTNFCIRDRFLVHTAHGTRKKGTPSKHDGNILLHKWEHYQRS